MQASSLEPLTKRLHQNLHSPVNARHKSICLNCLIQALLNVFGICFFLVRARASLNFDGDTCFKKIAFVSKNQYFGSFMMRGHEMATGFQMFTGVNAAVLSSKMYMKTYFRDNHFDVIVIVKYWSSARFIKKANREGRLLLHDTVDNYFNIPRTIGGLIVNTHAQKSFYFRAGVRCPMFVIPHHHSNYNGYRKTTHNVTSIGIVGTFPVTILDEVVGYLREHGIRHTLAPTAPPLKQPFLASASYSKFLASQDAILVWSYPSDEDFCFKPQTRFTMALSTGVPTIAMPMQSFVEAHRSYPLYANNSTQVVQYLDMIINKDHRVLLAVAEGLEIAYAHSLRNIVWDMYGHICSVFTPIKYVSPFARNLTLPRCNVENLSLKVRISDEPGLWWSYLLDRLPWPWNP